MDKLELLIKEKQAELQGLEAELREALTGIESPDYETAGRLQPIIYSVMAEIRQLEMLRKVPPAPDDFQVHLSRFITNDTLTVLELWTEIRDYWADVSIRVVEIRKLKSSREISCTIQLLEPSEVHLHAEYTATELKHLGWKAIRGEKTFYRKTKLRSPDQFEAFCQIMSVTFLEPLKPLWRHGQQYYRIK